MCDMDSVEEGHAAGYIYALQIVYFISTFIGAAFFPDIFGVEYSAGSYVAGFGAFLFFGLLLWPIFAAHNILMYFVFSVLAFLFLGFMFEVIIGWDRKGGDIPVDETGLRKRLKRARFLFAIVVIAFLVAVYIAIYNRDMTGEFYDAGYQAGYQDGVASVQTQGSRPAAEITSGWVYVTGAGEKYHRKDCRYVTDESKRLSLEDAISRGYEPCSVCKPTTSIEARLNEMRNSGG